MVYGPIEALGDGVLAGPDHPIAEPPHSRISSLKRESASLAVGAAQGPWRSMASEAWPAGRLAQRSGFGNIPGRPVIPRLRSGVAGAMSKADPFQWGAVPEK